MKYRIFLLLGSNEGNPLGNLGLARDTLRTKVGDIISQSSVYRTAAWGMESQADFYNQVIEIRSRDSPEKVLEKILAVEGAMGRVRREKWGPRIIDIDLLFHGKETRDTTTLKLPHPGIPQRRFTLAPLAEIAPDYIHPILQKTVAELLSQCKDPLRVEKLTSNEGQQTD